MRLPFTHEQFLAAFAAYNTAWWPAALVLWLLSIVAIWRLYRHEAGASRLLSAVLALQWGWAGAVYHLAYFRPINPAAAAFGLLFLVQSFLILRSGVLRSRLTFAPSRSAPGRVGGVLLGYALLYPVVGLLTGLRYPALPSFGVPCPTTILTAGAMLLAPHNAIRHVALIPVGWAVVGGSAAFLLAVPGDLVLLLAGALLLFYILAPGPAAPTKSD
jgi:hypothetical protein